MNCMGAGLEAVAAIMIETRRAVFLEHLYELRDAAAHCHVDAIELLALVARGVDRFLIEDRIERNSGLAGLPVADDKLALAAADWDQGVDGLKVLVCTAPSRFHTREDARRFHVDALLRIALDWAFAVDGVAEAVNGARAGPCPPALPRYPGVALLDGPVLAENNHAHIIGFEVQRHAADAAQELDHFTGLHIIESVHAGHDSEHTCLLAEILNPAL